MDYSSEVEQRFLSPSRAGEFEKGTPGLVSGEAADRTLNVWIRFQVQVLDGAIRTARFNVYGCPYTVAAADWAAEWLEGRPSAALEELAMFKRYKKLGVPVEKLGKLLLIEDAAAACWRGLESLERQKRS
jgi:NifU-like protein involved in Fe-S cluster formation